MPAVRRRISYDRIVPLIVAVALFMENMDFDGDRDVAAGHRTARSAPIRWR